MLSRGVRSALTIPKIFGHGKNSVWKRSAVSIVDNCVCVPCVVGPYLFFFFSLSANGIITVNSSKFFLLWLREKKGQKRRSSKEDCWQVTSPVATLVSRLIAAIMVGDAALASIFIWNIIIYFTIWFDLFFYVSRGMCSADGGNLCFAVARAGSSNWWTALRTYPVRTLRKFAAWTIGTLPPCCSSPTADQRLWYSSEYRKSGKPSSPWELEPGPKNKKFPENI